MCRRPCVTIGSCRDGTHEPDLRLCVHVPMNNQAYVRAYICGRVYIVQFLYYLLLDVDAYSSNLSYLVLDVDAYSSHHGNKSLHLSKNKLALHPSIWMTAWPRC
jgi:hypothetical protein